MKKILFPLLLLLLALPAYAEEGDVRIAFVNVGKADATVILTESGNYLIDTGKKKTVDDLIEALALLGVDRLDGVFLTHGHTDHVGALKKLGKEIEIAALYGSVYADAGVWEAAEKVDLPLLTLKAGDTVGEFTVVAPVVQNKNENDNSLVLLLAANGRTALFMGDAEFSEEFTILMTLDSGGFDILKVGNHGNPDATSAGFARFVSPSYAFISTDTGDDADSANPRVLENLSPAQIFVTENARLGYLCAISANGEISVAPLD